MITVAFITLTVLAAVFLFYVFFGKQSKEEPKDRIVWEKMDEHEKMLGE